MTYFLAGLGAGLILGLLIAMIVFELAIRSIKKDGR